MRPLPAVLAFALLLALPGLAAAHREGRLALTTSGIAGRWYEVARLPERGGRDCFNNTALGTLAPGDELEIVTACNKGSPSGREKRFTVYCRVRNEADRTRLACHYLFFHRELTVLEVGDREEYAVVASDDLAHLTIISRVPVLEEATYQRVLERLRARGIDPARLVRVPRG